ncbi:MAG: ABC transporter permease [Cytophagaceae bacterium]
MKKAEWDEIIKPTSGLFDLRLYELWRYRDLVMLFVKRNIVTMHKQTILGPLWHFIQPLFTAIAFTFVFANITSVDTGKIHPFLFYLSGSTIWTFFSKTLANTSNTFSVNSQIFSKVYFPRLVIPLSTVIANMFSFMFQLVLLFVVVTAFIYKGFSISVSWHLLWLPFLLVWISALGLGLGLILSALTTKYKDLSYFLNFGIQLLMFVSPIIFPLQSVPEQIRFWVMINPLTTLIELFRLMVIGNGMIDPGMMLYCGGFTIVFLFVGLLMFKKIERTFIDVV